MSERFEVEVANERTEQIHGENALARALAAAEGYLNSGRDKVTITRAREHESKPVDLSRVERARQRMEDSYSPGTAHEDEDNEPCEFCGGKGWAPSACHGSRHYPEGSIAILKCDECELFPYDEEAQAAARAAGYTLSDIGLVVKEPA